MERTSSKKAVFRLRLGVLFIALFWLPVWLLVPFFCAALNINSTQGKRDALIAVVLIQTACGIIGLLLAGREVVALFKKVPRRQVPGKVWRALRSGSADDLA